MPQGLSDGKIHLKHNNITTMEKEEIKRVFDDVQQRLDTLQDSEASFLFIGHQGNHFTISGHPIEMAAQIVFAMIRYPVIRNIIKECAEKYDSLNAQYGNDVRDVKMDHLIEQNSGN